MDERDAEAQAVKRAREALRQRATEQTGHDRRAHVAEAERNSWVQARQDAVNYRTVEERAAEERAKLYARLKARDALDVYYQFYPDERPRAQQMSSRDDEGRAR